MMMMMNEFPTTMLKGVAFVERSNINSERTVGM